MRALLFKITLGTWFVLWAPILLITLPSKWLLRKFMITNARGVIWIARAVGIKCKIHQSPFDKKFKISPDQPIIASKHMSILEVAMLITHVPNAFFIIKRELMYIPIYGWAFWRMGMQAINRKTGATNMKVLATAVKKKIDSGKILIIYPEGTRTYPGKPIKLKRGLLFLAESLNLPIRPVGTDAGIYLDRDGKIKPGTANLYFEQVLPANATLDEIGAAINRRSA